MKRDRYKETERTPRAKRTERGIEGGRAAQGKKIAKGSPLGRLPGVMKPESSHTLEAEHVQLVGAFETAAFERWGILGRRQQQHGSSNDEGGVPKPCQTRFRIVAEVA